MDPFKKEPSTFTPQEPGEATPRRSERVGGGRRGPVRVVPTKKGGLGFRGLGV